MTSEDLRRYKEKSGDVTVGGQFALEEEGKGFVTFSISPSALIINCMYGDGKYWVGRMEEVARKYGRRKIVAGSKRNPRAIERRLGFKVTGFLFEKEVEG